MSCLRLLGVTACWQWPDLRRSSTRSSRSGRSCVRRGARNRSRSFSRRTRNARSRCSPNAGSPPFAPRKPALTRLQRASPGARRAPSPPPHPPNGRPICPGAGLSMKRKRCCSLPPSESRWWSTRSHGLPAIRTQFPHKTEAGAVCLDIADRAEFDRGVRAMLERVPAARAVLVQKMESGLAEAIVGYRDDPVVGPIVLVGAGGALAEIYKDYALRLAPVSEDEAAAMIAEVKGLAAVRGYRGLPRGDVRALAQAVAALSRLALTSGRSVAEAEINPLIVKREGAVAVDALVVMKEQDF